jgi:flagellar assembly protein FliH
MSCWPEWDAAELNVHDKASVLIEEFRYPPTGNSAPSIWQDFPIIHVDTESPGKTSAPCRPPAPAAFPDERQQQFSAQLAEEVQRSFAAGRVQGVEEGRRVAREEQGARLLELEKEKIKEIAQLAEEFAHKRDTLLQTLEQDVVRLSLSIASRILRREAQMDPLFLVGAVRVALGQLAEAATVLLRVPAADAELWTETIAHLPNLRVKPKVVGDEKMRLGGCALETDMGSADLGVRSHLTEICRELVDDAASTNAHQALSAVWEMKESK